VNNKILIYIAGILIIIGFFFIFNDSDSEIKNPIQEANKVSEKISKQDVSTNELIKNKDSFNKIVNKKTKNRENEVEITNNYQISDNDNNQVTNNNKSLKNYDNEYNEFIFNKKEFDNFVDENNLEEIKNIDNNTKIYAKNSPVKNDFAPPMPPVLIKVKFREKNKIIPINSNLITSNKKIYVVNENTNNKKIEVKEIDTKNISSFMPPAIGQN
jgi:hypothetical protein